MPVKLQTPVQVPGPSKQLGFDTILAGIGSCFSQNILGHLFGCGIGGAQNPNGIVYNAVSIADALTRIAEQKPYAISDFFEFNGLWHSWLHHGAFSNRDPDAAVETANQSFHLFGKVLKDASCFVMTPSSSVVYCLDPDQRVVANCHKVPGTKFTKRLLSVEENLTALTRAITAVRTVNPDTMIVITLSPVRHYPGDLLLNSRSKSNLMAAIGTILDQVDDILYFPSYEIVMDELRDYRFYADDMLHVSSVTETIIFNRFIDTYFTPEAVTQIHQAEKEARSAAHRDLH